MSVMQGRRLKQEDAVVATLLRACPPPTTDACINSSHPLAPEACKACKDVLFAGLFDGHGGSWVSETAATRVHRLVQTSPLFHAGDYGAALKQSLADFDREIASFDQHGDGRAQHGEDRGHARIRRRMARAWAEGREGRVGGEEGGGAVRGLGGTTAVVVLIETYGSQATIANIGDSSAAVMRVTRGDGVLSGRTLTVAHKPNRPEERERILVTV